MREDNWKLFTIQSINIPSTNVQTNYKDIYVWKIKKNTPLQYKSSS